jgi:CPA1 family monovalent cation:H+ antiporter
VALALALSLPLELDYWLTVQSLVYGVVLFTLTVQVLLMSLLLRQPASRRLPE